MSFTKTFTCTGALLALLLGAGSVVAADDPLGSGYKVFSKDSHGARRPVGFMFVTETSGTSLRIQYEPIAVKGVAPAPLDKAFETIVHKAGKRDGYRGVLAVDKAGISQALGYLGAKKKGSRIGVTWKTSGRGTVGSIQFIAQKDDDAARKVADDPRLDELWARIAESRYPSGGLPMDGIRPTPSVPPGMDPKEFAAIGMKMAAQAFSKAFVAGDVRPDRSKRFHTRGTVARVRWVPSASTDLVKLGYRGRFYLAGARGLIRMSFTAFENEQGERRDNPALALKFFFPDKANSINVQASAPFAGIRYTTPYRNVLGEDLSNLAPFPSPSETNILGLLVLVEKLKITREPIRRSFYAFSVDRDESTSKAPHLAPYQVVFKPLTQISADTDYRQGLAELQAETPLYAVYARGWIHDPNASQGMQRLGTLILESSFVASNFSDRRLHIMHPDTPVEEATDAQLERAHADDLERDKAAAIAKKGH